MPTTPGLVNALWSHQFRFNSRTSFGLKGYNVIGGSAFGDRLENDRAFALDLLRGPRLQIGGYRCEFDNITDALADLQRRPRRCVFKRCDSAGDTFVGTFDDGAGRRRASSPGRSCHGASASS